MSTIPNLLVLSAGGFGHAAVPLFKQSARPLGDLPRSGRWLVIFRGSETAPGAFRSKVKRVVEEATAARRGWATQVDVGVGSIVNWREQMRWSERRRARENDFNWDWRSIHDSHYQHVEQRVQLQLRDLGWYPF